MNKIILFFLFTGLLNIAAAQPNWTNIDSLYEPLPNSLQVFKSTDTINGKPVVMYYAIADLEDRNLTFTADTTLGRRLTPSAFYEKNQHPLLVVNTSFFSFETNRNLNLVVKNGETLGYNVHAIARKGADTLTWLHPFGSALGIFKNRTADVAWIYSDTTRKSLYAWQEPVPAYADSNRTVHFRYIKAKTRPIEKMKKWKVETAVGGGPVLIQNSQIVITNNEEHRFAGKAINDLHPRTAIGYTADHKLIVFVCEGRSEQSSGLSLTQMAEILQSLGCKEALNLDGGGSTCMLINGKETNFPSDKGEQRPVPSVFLIK